MKSFLTSLKRQSGFTLVELMVVVAIIGLLSAVAVPNFKKYQAKAKTTEAKLQLSALYTAEQAFYSDFNMYAACLRYMGYDPSLERSNRYYAIGFPDGLGVRDPSAHTSAVGSGLLAADCPATAAATGDAGAASQTVFIAGKGIGGSIIDTIAKMTGNVAGAAGTCTVVAPAAPTGGSCLGTQADNTEMTFIAAAVGFISQDAIDGTGALASGMTINNYKTITVLRNGF